MVNREKLYDICREISVMGSHDLDRIVEALKLRRDFLHSQTARTIRIGDQVQFEGRRGTTVSGTVVQVKIKKVLLETNTGERWNVPAGLLRASQKEVVSI